MTRRRYIPKKMINIPYVPFLNAEQAWFWYVRAQQARNDGARFEAAATEVRPCDPDDMYRAVMGLVRHKRLDDEHIRVLTTYGINLSPPDPRIREQERAYRMWDEALDRLTTVLRKKGIVE